MPWHVHCNAQPEPKYTYFRAEIELNYLLRHGAGQDSIVRVNAVAGTL